MSAVKVDDGKIICKGFAVCDAESNIADVDNTASGDPTYIVALGDTLVEIWPKAYVIA